MHSKGHGPVRTEDPDRPACHPESSESRAQECLRTGRCVPSVRSPSNRRSLTQFNPPRCRAPSCPQCTIRSAARRTILDAIKRALVAPGGCLLIAVRDASAFPRRRFRGCGARTPGLARRLLLMILGFSARRTIPADRLVGQAPRGRSASGLQAGRSTHRSSSTHTDTSGAHHQ